MLAILIKSLLFSSSFLLSLVNSQNCDFFGGCFCSTDPTSEIYQPWIAPDVGSYPIICDPSYFGLRLESGSIYVRENFTALQIIPLNPAPLSFQIEPKETSNDFTTVLCTDARGDPKQNALVQTNSSVTKKPVRIKPATSDLNIEFHVFIVRYNHSMESWTQLPRSVCKQDAKDSQFACLPENCEHCSATNGKSDAEEECQNLKLKYWPSDGNSR